MHSFNWEDSQSRIHLLCCSTFCSVLHSLQTSITILFGIVSSLDLTPQVEKETHFPPKGSFPSTTSKRRRPQQKSRAFCLVYFCHSRRPLLILKSTPLSLPGPREYRHHYYFPAAAHSRDNNRFCRLGTPWSPSSTSSSLSPSSSFSSSPSPSRRRRPQVIVSVGTTAAFVLDVAVSLSSLIVGRTHLE